MMISTKDAAGNPRLFAFGALLGFVAAALGAAAYLAGGPVLALLAALAAAALGALSLTRIVPAILAASKKAPEGAKPQAGEKRAEAEAPIPPDRIDQLTGLANANGLMAWFAEKAERMEEDKMGIVVLVADLDDFAALERSRGKSIAEAVLIEVAKRVSVIAEGEGIAARLSEEQFAAVAAVVPERAAEIAAERAGKLSEMIGRPVEHPNGAIWIGGSVGGASGKPREGEKVLAKARAAHAKAKRLGRGNYVVDNGA
ncbi:MAG: diguanylate cyclase [Spirochaetaceae bacterium]|nr:diguanylate cyclase [Spirochaetaceae bacterium]